MAYNLSICYITGRSAPHIEWALEAIAKQRDGNDVIDFLVVDALGRSREELVPDEDLIARSVQELRVVPVKPNIWQGLHRVTSKDCWAKSNAANTAICLARHGYLAFLDDCCRLGEHWLSNTRVGNQDRKSVIAGTYVKIEGDKRSVDNRFQHSPNGRRGVPGGWLFGCTFALPLEWALTVNGFEEGCDGLSMEDVIFGSMLHNNGYRIDFVPSMYVELDRGPQANTFYRTDKGVSPNDKSHAALHRFSGRRRTEFTPSLRELRDSVLAANPFPIPDPSGDHRDWYDGQPSKDV